MRTVLTVCLTALLLAGMARDSRASVVSQAMDSTVIIYADYLGDDGLMHYSEPVCSGFVVDALKTSEVVATAAHCTADVADRRVQFFDGDDGRVVGVHAAAFQDVAVLYVRSHRSHRAAPLTSAVNPGDHLFVVGMPSGMPWSYSDARSRNGSQEFAVDGEGPELAFEAPAVWHGDSGGGIFNAYGRVVAVVNAGGDEEYPAVVFGCPSGYLKNLF